MSLATSSGMFGSAIFINSMPIGVEPVHLPYSKRAMWCGNLGSMSGASANMLKTMNAKPAKDSTSNGTRPSRTPDKFMVAMAHRTRTSKDKPLTRSIDFRSIRCSHPAARRTRLTTIPDSIQRGNMGMEENSFAFARASDPSSINTNVRFRPYAKKVAMNTKLAWKASVSTASPRVVRNAAGLRPAGGMIPTRSHSSSSVAWLSCPSVAGAPLGRRPMPFMMLMRTMPDTMPPTKPIVALIRVVS
mmetsp:Transcript_67553/g.188485  ORF Transcript_67553/g.188485 Transcript_67553/m.188485 type:complete len:245 (+) Transcript_67553:307-1041(+)